MTLLGFLLLLLIAAVCGGLGQSIAGYSLGGCLVSIVVGFIGALLGSWIAGQLGFSAILPVNIQGRVIPVVWAIVGSAILTIVIGLITRGRARRY